MSDIRLVTSTNDQGRTVVSGDDAFRGVAGNRGGAVYTMDDYRALVAQGYGFVANGGAQTTPITFAGAYDATAPDFYLYIPSGKTVIPLSIEIIFEAVGTESTMECIATASTVGDSSATGTAVTPKNLRLGGSESSDCTCTVAVDGSGVTTHLSGTYFDFWKFQRPLTDTVATGENDRLPLVFRWNGFQDGVPPYIIGSAAGSCLAIHAASQAGTGFITVQWLEIPSSWIS